MTLRVAVVSPSRVRISDTPLDATEMAGTDPCGENCMVLTSRGCPKSVVNRTM